MEFDLPVRNGTVVDGTGEQARKASLPAPPGKVLPR